MFKHRLLTAAIGIPMLLAVLVAGEPWFSLVAALLAGVCCWELWSMARARGLALPLPLMVGAAVLLTLIGVFGLAYTPLVLTVALVATLAWSLRYVQQPNGLVAWGLSLAGPLYIGWPLAHFILLRGEANGLAWVALTIFSVFTSDTGGYAVGRLLGRHKLAPAISPKKTLEGALGGLAGGALAVSVLVSVLGLPLPLIQAVALGLVLSFAAQLGDLVESGLKRLLGAKDASQLLPGHGGLLDRMDSLGFAVLVVYYFLFGWPP